MTFTDENLGRIEVSPSAIATLVAEAVQECYGVVGMSSRNIITGLTGSLQRGARRGITVQRGEDGIVVDIYVIVEYGTRITEVAAGVMRRVRFTLENVAGLPIEAINVHVQGLRVDDEQLVAKG
ncbi:MAG: Asp23/Gls24 family envelope stress response protein [Chloroflexota bacterium]|nr:Asp23/Gls24 family envelope stress response protein [Chloroflexota bacterium]